MDTETGEAAVPPGRSHGGIAANHPTILVPIRYPLSVQSTRTLEYACQTAREYDAKELIVLHVDLYQRSRTTTPEEIQETIAPLVSDQPVSVIVGRTYLLEEAILEEVESARPDIIVLGKNRKPAWRRLLGRIVGDDLNVASVLCARTDAQIIVVT